jgi:hypothetical protein
MYLLVSVTPCFPPVDVSDRRCPVVVRMGIREVPGSNLGASVSYHESGLSDFT